VPGQRPRVKPSAGYRPRAKRSPVSRMRIRRPRSAPPRSRSPGQRPRRKKRASATEVGLECPHRRSAWAKPNHTGQGAESENQAPSENRPLTRVLASGRPSDAGGASALCPHWREVCPPARHAFAQARLRQTKGSPPARRFCPSTQRHNEGSPTKHLPTVLAQPADRPEKPSSRGGRQESKAPRAPRLTSSHLRRTKSRCRTCERRRWTRPRLRRCSAACWCPVR
jgi:hypothetical protein